MWGAGHQTVSERLKPLFYSPLIIPPSCLRVSSDSFQLSQVQGEEGAVSGCRKGNNILEHAAITPSTNIANSITKHSDIVFLLQRTNDRKNEPKYKVKHPKPTVLPWEEAFYTDLHTYI